MKKTLLFLSAIQLLLFNCLLTQAQTVTLVQSSYGGATFSVITPEVLSSTQTVDGENYINLSFEGSTHLFREGEPDLPVVSQMIEIPLCSEVQVSVSNIQSHSIGLSALVKGQPSCPLLPMQPAPSKSDRSPRPFVMDSAIYSTDAYYSAPAVAWVDRVGTARDKNLAALRISPISYNPVTGQVVIITHLTVTLTYKGGDEASTRRLHERYHSPAFAAGNNIVAALPSDAKSVRDDAPLHYLIVAHSSFRGALDDFVAWKKRQGFLVTVGYTDQPEVGTSATSIAAYTKSFYTNATDELPAPTFLLLVGDHQQIPAFDSRCSSPANDHVSDLYYATWTEGDILPDCYMGRFSARNMAELTPQIEKTIYYESYAFDDDSYLSHGVLIAGVDRGYTGDNAYNYADPAMDYIAKTYINASNGYSTVHYYKNNINFAPDGVQVSGSSNTSATDNYLRTLYNQGCGWVNYSAHGYDGEWSSPNFSTSHVASMTNAGKPSIMIGNCCLSGRFNTSYSGGCLGEALLRKTDYAGAAAYFGATNSTYWPHDFCWAVGVRSSISNSMNTSYDASHLGMYDRLFHTHNESHSAWHITAGSINMAGNMAVETYGSYSLYYWEIYELFGDPSLMPWLGQATDMNVTYQPVIPIDSSTYTVKAAPYSYVAITTADNHDLVCAAYANGNGKATLHLPTNLIPGTYELAVWAQNRKPVFEEITITVLNGPYVMITQVEPTATAVPGKLIYFDLTLTNVGNTIPTAGLVTMNSTQPGITFIQPVAHFTHCDPGDTVLIHASCPAYLSDKLTDGQTLPITITVDFGPSQSTYRTNLHIAAPHLIISNVNATPQLNADSASTITCRITNTGSAPSDEMTLTLVNDFGFVNHAPDPVSLPSLQAGESLIVQFFLTLNSYAPSTIIPFYLYATTDEGTNLVDTLHLNCGTICNDDFESGTLNHLSWRHNSQPWIVTNSEAYEGTFSARSSNSLPNRAESRMSITWENSEDDYISFYYKVSSEEGYDIFRFTIDGNEYLSASGEVDWTFARFPVTAGSHIISFRYSKDNSAVGGSDCAWIDNVSLPFVGGHYQFDIDQVCVNTQYTFGETGLPTDQTGTFTYIDTTTIPWHYLALTVLDAPEVTIQVIRNQSEPQCMLLKAHGADSYVWNTGDSTDCIAVCPQGTTTYTVTGSRSGCSGEASTTLLSVDRPAADPQVSLYPNPATNQATISASRLVSVKLINLMGQEVTHRRVNNDTVTLDLQNLPRGIYFVRIETVDTTTTRKLIKQ